MVKKATCECGCGREVSIDQKTKLPNRWVPGHQYSNIEDFPYRKANNAK